jgi:2-dehydro-3-deoxyphosphogluconate aldolase/(4S)-4-hydroxy-2-oxoglutarate aldolase
MTSSSSQPPEDRNAVIERTRRAVLEDGVIVAVRMGSEDPVLEACRAALRGGLHVLEITLTTPGALDVIRTLAEEGEAVVGAGTVLSPEDARLVARAGGRFALSPVFLPEVVDESHRLGLLAVPGAGSATEILAAHRQGARLVKVFPAGPLGGPDFLRSIRGPLPDVPLVPTSGPTASNLSEYLAAGAVAVGVGSEVFPVGFTLEGAEESARRLRRAMDAAR